MKSEILKMKTSNTTVPGGIFVEKIKVCEKLGNRKLQIYLMTDSVYGSREIHPDLSKNVCISVPKKSEVDK